MFKKLSAILLALFVFVGFSVNVSAQTEDQSNWKNFCFTATQCHKEGSGCQDLKDAVHRAALKVDNATANYLIENNAETYVVECLYKNEGDSTPICTTGNANLDATSGVPVVSAGSFGAVGFDLAPFLADLTAPTVRIANPVDPALLSGSLMWHDVSATYSRIFFGYYQQPPPQPTQEMGQGGEQQAELPIDFESASKVCKPLVWDPYGRVFDSQSLEPVEGSTVTLSVNENGNYRIVSPSDIDITGGGSFINPFLTKRDGQFSFYVADGTYKLAVSDPDYAFPSVLSLNPNYDKAFYEIYPQGGVYEIVEKGGDQHRDIPVDSKTSPTITPLKIMEIIAQADKLGSIFVSGRVSHPLSVISIYSMTPGADGEAASRYQLIDQVTTDRYGKFEFTVDQSALDRTVGEYFGEIEIAKNAEIYTLDTTTNILVKQFEPLPSYLEGIAKNAEGVAQPDIQVAIFAESSNKPYYKTTTDANGVFSIPSDYIPSLPYRLVYTSGGVNTTVKPSKFIKDNVEYIAQNKTELFKPHYLDSKVNEKLEESGPGFVGGNNGASSGNVEPSQPAGGIASLSQNTALLGTLAFIVTLVIVGVAFVIYMKKNKPQGF